MQVKLFVISGGPADSEINIRVPAVIGRSREANLAVPHPQVSRRHCELIDRDGLLVLRDLKSTNGTLVGGRKVVEAPLLPDSQFTVGPLTVRVSYEYDGDVADVPPIRFADDGQTPAQSAALQVPETVAFEPAAEEEAVEFDASGEGEGAAEEEDFDLSLDDDDGLQTETLEEPPEMPVESAAAEEADEFEVEEPQPSLPPTSARAQRDEPDSPPAPSKGAEESEESSVEQAETGPRSAVPSAEEDDEAFDDFFSDLK